MFLYAVSCQESGVQISQINKSAVSGHGWSSSKSGEGEEGAEFGTWGEEVHMCHIYLFMSLSRTIPDFLAPVLTLGVIAGMPL